MDTAASVSSAFSLTVIEYGACSRIDAVVDWARGEAEAEAEADGRECADESDERACKDGS